MTLIDSCGVEGGATGYGYITATTRLTASDSDTLYGDVSACPRIMLNDTQLTEFVGWQPIPWYRGTWQIICLCVMTLGLCLHTSLHLNIETPQPWQEHRWFRKMGLDAWREAQWVLVGLFAPELVLYIAYRQAEVVRKLTPTVENLWRQVSRMRS